MLSKYSGMSHMRTQVYSASSEGLHLALAAGHYESVDCSTGMEWWNGILE